MISFGTQARQLLRLRPRRMPRPHSCRGEDERHGTTIKSLPNRPWSSSSEPNDTTLPPAQRQHLRNATLFLSQLSQENRRGRERASPDQASDGQVSILGIKTTPIQQALTCALCLN